MKTWRQIARPIIFEVISRVGIEDGPGLQAALRDAYPFGARQHYPYHVWLDEIKKQKAAALKHKPGATKLHQLPLFQQPQTAGDPE